MISHHQLPLARKIAEMVGVENFRFAVTDPPHAHIERQQLGWNSQENEPWIIRAGEFDKDQKELEQWWDEADEERETDALEHHHEDAAAALARALMGSGPGADERGALLRGHDPTSLSGSAGLRE